MEPVANHYPRVCCWQCEHFQRYDSTLPFPTKCDGECRAAPIAGAFFVTNFAYDEKRNFGLNSEIAYAFPHIPCGLRNRCAQFKASMEKDIPKSPMSLDCQREAPTIAATWQPWIKPGKESCATCIWFEPEYCQRKHPAQPDNGACLYYPPRPRRYHWFERFLPRVEIGVTATLIGAARLWCSQWDGPRPEFQIGPDPEKIETPADLLTRWESRRARLVWQTSLTLKAAAPAAPPVAAAPLKAVDNAEPESDDQPGGPI